MRILHSYIMRGFLITFSITLLVFLFVMAIGNIFKVIDLFSRGVSGLLILKVFSYGIPASLNFAIPMGVLAAVFLQFSRLAGDREIIAMRACGISPWNIILPPLMISLILCGICLFINCDVVPNCHYARRKVLSKLGVETPLSLLDEGRFIREFPGLTIYIGRKNDRMLKDIVIYQVGKDGIKRTIRAASGSVAAATNKPGLLQVNLFNVRMEQPDEQHPDNLLLTRRVNASEYPLQIDVQELVNRDIVWKKKADLTMREIINALRLSLRFVPADILNPDLIVSGLRHPQDPIAAYFQASLSKAALSELNNYDGSDIHKKRMAQMLAAEFNRIISGACIYSPKHFAPVKLRDQTVDLLHNSNPEEPATKLNRMLIEDAFPESVAKSVLLDIYRGNLDMFRTALLVEANTRITLSCTCFAFVLLGAALGIKIHRKESSVGIAVALLLVFIFYFFIIIADSLVNRPEFHPYLITWIPFFLSEIIGFFLIQQSN